MGAQATDKAEKDGGAGVLAIFGPTASGKSAVSVELARRLPAELISADSMQLYRGVPILTDQPAAGTHLVAIWELSAEGTLAEYQRLAHTAIDETLERQRTPVVVGGTGLYLRAALAELDVPQPVDPLRRAHWERVYDRIGGPCALELLRGRDPDAAAALHANDRRRVVRALELVEAGGSLYRATSRLWTAETRHPTLVFGLEVPRELLMARIESRVHSMFSEGVEGEVGRALERGVSRSAAQMIGLREIADLPRDEAIAAIVARTRTFASYQLKWMRRIPGLVSVAADRPPGEVADEIVEVARARQLVPARRAG